MLEGIATGCILCAVAFSGEYFGVVRTLLYLIIIMICHLILKYTRVIRFTIERPHRPIAYRDVRDVAALHYDLHLLPRVDGLDALVINKLHGDVHDHAIQQSIIAGIEALKKWAKGKTIQEDTESQIKKYIFNGTQGDINKRELAYNTLRTMVKINGRLESVGMTEMEILALIWARICDPVNTEVQDELKNNLIESMADATIVLDSQYCLTGRITRIVQAIESIDKEDIVNIRSTESVKAEITLKMGALRTGFFKANPGYEEIYNNDIDNEETRRINQELKDYVNNELRREYVPLITEETLGHIVGPLVEAL